MAERVLLTPAGETRLRAELKRLKSNDRPKVIAAIAEARAHGDLSENAEYHAAREEQGFCEGRIKEIEGKLSNSIVIDVKTIPPTGKVIFGTTVDIVNCATEEQVTYRIVGEDEANIKAGLISCTSPIARAMIGKTEGDEIVFSAPGGEKYYEIIQIQYI